MPAGGSTGAKSAPFTKTLGHLTSGSKAMTATAAVHSALDEAQMRTMLEQLKLASRGDSLPFHRYDLVNRNNGKLREMIAA